MIGTDKLLHFWFSFIIAFTSPGLAWLAGIGKEAYDALSGGAASLGDLIADGFGILIGVWASPFF
ncbi:MAG: hypothetical protein AMXMBFR82_48860 [Candidatus Hydrogenedentota bacterium]